MTAGRQRLITAIVFGVIVALGWFAYAPALSGAFLLDDAYNLSGLRRVEDALSALNFVFSGDAGPLGRPLALATFLPQAAAWGQDTTPFLRVNILVHLTNACVLAFVLYRLSVLSRIPENTALIAGAAGAALWLFMPLLASASLMIVQRMTTLSALFMLLGLAGYLWARQSIHRHPGKALTGMSISLATGTILAAFSKENGALLPTFVLVLESTLLTRPSNVRISLWRGWMSVFLLFPTILILAYLMSRVPYSPELALRRDFTGWQRLLTESRILWEYLFNAFVPAPGKFGPFHDGYPVARTIFDPVTFLAFSGWLVSLTMTVFWRRRYPLMAFAILWFLCGHMVESTVIPLELYFEHRNYLPIIGPVYALCMFAVRVPVRRKKLAYAGMSVYIAINALVLLGQTSLWGEPALAASIWQQRSPESVRAATTVVSYELAQDGARSVLARLHQLVEEHPEAGYVKIQELNLRCIVAPSEDARRTVGELETLLKGVDFSYTAGTMLSELFTTVSKVECNGVDNDTVRLLARSLLSNPRYTGDRRYNQLHHQLMARISRHEGKFGRAIQQLERASGYGASTELNMMMVTTLADAQDFGAARAYIEEARQKEPKRPIKAYLWQRDLDGLSNYVDAMERHAGRENASDSTANDLP